MVFLSSCINAKLIETLLPGIDIPVENMNKEMILKTSSISEQAYLSTSIIYLLAINESDSPISINESTGIKLYHEESGKWAQFTNELNYPENEIILNRKTISPLGIDIAVLPDYCLLKRKDSLRIVLIGKQESTNKDIGAFIDVDLINQYGNDADCK